MLISDCQKVPKFICSSTRRRGREEGEDFDSSEANHIFRTVSVISSLALTRVVMLRRRRDRPMLPSMVIYRKWPLGEEGLDLELYKYDDRISARVSIPERFDKDRWF